MARARGRISRFAVAAVLVSAAGLLAGCGSGSGSADGGGTDGGGTAAPTTSTTGSDATNPGPASTTAPPASVTASPSPSVIGGSDDPATIEMRNRLLAVSTGFNQSRATCFADPVACQPAFDTTLGRHLTGSALSDVRTNLDTAAARGVRTRGIDVAAMYYQGFQLYKENPVDAALSLCVVDKGVQYIPATGAEPEKIVDGSQATYFVVYRIQAGADGTLRISDIGNTEFVPLVGEYGQCDEYAH